ncbi:hypothetical protein PMNALOAF_2686 [Methylobacterium adhaesivum]|jgi:hypothetical protein|uniref:Uncharacterized protein n=1 Tax=Methylobacterium adhaesivum TaxID=333297 RepID=A0ABT8BL41_9HYPH|nr:hypothetical protein [Methylobacterium adhaesivum]MDN3592041.1 hypothetical protein [Methylobacterium adhaesivum]GJD31428.1 hypothetical protein PMNALOAF_2686 [Methylobacterium adhaesivum]
MISAVSISSGGMALAAQQFAETAKDVVVYGTSLPSPTQVSLSSMALELIANKNDVSLNAAVLRSSLDTEKRVLDILV